MVLQLGLVARRSECALPIAQLAHCVKHDVRRGRNGGHKGRNVADSVPWGGRVPGSDLQRRHPLSQGEETRAGQGGRSCDQRGTWPAQDADQREVENIEANERGGNAPSGPQDDGEHDEIDERLRDRRSLAGARTGGAPQE